MTTMDLQRYRAALTAKIAELSLTLGDRRLIAVENTPEECERIVLAAQRELAVDTLDRHSRLLREVKSALARIEDGSYGVCESCDEAIKPRRLDALPWARFCVHCQDNLDRGPGPSAAQFAKRMPLAA